MSQVVSRADRPERPIAHRLADEFRFHTWLQGPIAELSLLRRSLALAEVSMVAYLTPEQCNLAAGRLGFTGGQYFSVRGSQAYWFHNEHDSVIVIRGTEPNRWNDIKTDANAITALAETIGRVHRGFKRETDELWPLLEKALLTDRRTLWFTGHSLGGAMATICAARCLLSHIHSEPAELHTFGSPRVGCRRYISHAPVAHFRWVNNNDIVTRVPPVWLGYRHGGQEMYLDHLGQVRQLSGWGRVADRLRGFGKGLLKFRIDQLGDHSTLDYIAHIFEAVRREESVGGKSLSRPEAPHDMNSRTDSEAVRPAAPPPHPSLAGGRTAGSAAAR
jgi:triacylglycerol lipase